ncbi:Fe-S-cluster-containing hydrogenase components 2 [Citrobacter freundii]|uniref:Fe-S-cluster-containing hydrogenase components 2 n=1 Tax=Citrobacter freundii TaxID=546 RepID=A0A7G2IKF2_CITFR|nr:Fe-S-cluster-containing hydrogenase components 2 [Citrobacter freundii]
MNASADILSLLEKLMNRFIIADANKCIGCRTCEVACVVSHQDNQDCASLTPETFLPRIHVIKGVNVSTATLCRQCEDAPCANVCPNGAISRDKGFVHVMQERCIGCKNLRCGLSLRRNGSSRASGCA